MAFHLLSLINPFLETENTILVDGRTKRTKQSRYEKIPDDIRCGNTSVDGKRHSSLHFRHKNSVFKNFRISIDVV